MKRTILVILSVVAVLLACLFLPVHIPYTVKSKGKVIPVREWVLGKSQDGRMTATLYDNKVGATESYSVTQFERGDAVQFSLHPAIFSERAIARGDTIGRIYSNEIERQLAQLRGDLGTQTATLEELRTGSKQAVVDEEQKRVARAEERVAAQTKIVERLRTLFAREYVPEEQLEVEENRLSILEQSLEIARAGLAVAQSGAKPEELEVINARRAALANEIVTLQKRLDQFTFLSPLSGIIKSVYSSDTLAVISDTTELIVLIPVRSKERSYVNIGQSISISAPGVKEKALATLAKMDNSMHMIGSEQVVLATGIVNAHASSVMPGMIAECVIECEELTPLEYAVRFLNSVIGA